jgi:hypothetical protein
MAKGAGAAEHRARRVGAETSGACRVIERQSPVDLVVALIRIINGEAPRLAAGQILDPEVELCVDSQTYCGIDVWYKWIYLIRNCGRVGDLRMSECRVYCDARDPSLVHLSARWTGMVRSRRTVDERDGEGRYLIRDGRIRKIWTHKSNYGFIFGRWICNPIGYRLFLACTVVYFSLLSLRNVNFRADLTQEVSTQSIES